MLKYFITVLLSIILFNNRSFTQVNISYQFPDTLYSNLSIAANNESFIHIINTSNQIINGKLKVKIFFNNSIIGETNDDLTNMIVLNPSQTYNYIDTSNSIVYLDTNFWNDFNKKKIEQGVYTFCLQFYELQTEGDPVTTLWAPISLLYCNDILVINPLPVTLISPNSNDSFGLNLCKIAFSWNRPNTNLSSINNVNYKISIYTVNEGQSVSSALYNNTPLIKILPYGLNFTDFKISELYFINEQNYYYDSTLPTKLFFWNVELLSDNNNLICKDTITSDLGYFKIYNNSSFIPDEFDSISLITKYGDCYDDTLELYSFIDNLKELIQQKNNNNLPETFQSSYIQLDCQSDGFESNNLNGWEGKWGNRIPIFGSCMLTYNGFNSDRHTIISVNTGNDPIIPTLPKVFKGTYSLKLGNELGKRKCQSATCSLSITNDNKLFTFWYSYVFKKCPNNWNHPDKNLPAFTYKIYLDNNTVPFQEETFNQKNDPYNINYGEYYTYKQWTKVPFDLTLYIGHTVRIEFITSDCTPGQNFGYAYIDGFCCDENAIASFTLPNGTNYCSNATNIILDGSSSTNVNLYTISIQQCDINGTINPSKPEYKELFPKQIGTLNLSNLLITKNGILECGQYYKIKLSVQSGCNAWDEITQVIYILPCLESGITGDCRVCSNDNNQYCIVGNFNNGFYPSGTSFLWQPGNMTNQYFVVHPSQTTVYTLTLSNPNYSCSTPPVTTTVFVDDLPDVQITQDDKICQRGLYANPIPSNSVGTYLWSTNETTKSIVVSPADEFTQYSCTITNICGSVTRYIGVYKVFYSGDFPNIDGDLRIHPLRPDDAVANQKLHIKDLSLNCTDCYPAFNATSATLIIEFPLSNPLSTNTVWTGSISKTPYLYGFRQNCINWDGYFDGMVLDMWFNYHLRLSNCTSTNKYALHPYEVRVKKKLWGWFPLPDIFGYDTEIHYEEGGGVQVLE